MISSNPPVWALAGLLSLGATGCVSMGGPLAIPSPDEIPGLAVRVANDPTDLDAGLRLAAAYRGVDSLSAADEVVSRLAVSYPDDLGVLTLTGLIAEDRGQFVRARTSYQAVLAAAPGRELGDLVRQRVAIVRRAEMQADVAQALAREAELTQSTPDPSRVGVFPFVYEGDDPEWEPLAYALPELLATDLGVTGRITLVERLRIQALLDELALAEESRVEPSTAARSGRLLGSGHVVQGRVRIEPERQIAVDASVVEVLAPGAEQVDPVGMQDAIERFFELEKQLAFAIHAELGIQLTPAERERINERQTESLEALLAYGRGLRASYAGNYDLARQNFADAADIDPSFSLATEAQTEMQAVTTASTTAGASAATQQLAQQREAVQQVQASGPVPAPSQILSTLTTSPRSVLAEVTGQDRVGQATLLTLILRPPPRAP